MERDYEDAVAFKPKLNVVVHGFGLFSNYHKKDVTYEIKVAFNSEQPTSDWI
jgi:hypothetical protein